MEEKRKRGRPRKTPAPTLEQSGPAVPLEILPPEKEHTRLSFSKAHQYLECEGSVYYAEKYPEVRKSEHAEEGTLAHSCAEAILTDVLIKDKSLVVAFEEQKARMDAEMSSHVLNYCTEVIQLVAQLRPEKIAVEKKLTFSKELELVGTADVALLCRSVSGQKVGVVVDLKYGQGVAVDVLGNPQLAGYAVALDATEGWGEVHRAVVFIYQPRCEHPEGALRSWRLSREDLDYWKGRFLEAAPRVLKAVESGTPVMNAGDHCRWCRGQAVCEEYAKKMRGNGAEFLPLPSEPGPVDLPLSPEKLTARQLQRLIEKRSEIESFLKRVEEFATERLLAGQTIEGLKLVRGRSLRKWSGNEDDIANNLISRGVKEPWTQKLIGIGEAEKLLGKGKIDDLTEKPDGRIQIAVVDDPRPSITPGAEFLGGKEDE